VKSLPLPCLGSLIDHLIDRLYKNVIHSRVYIAWLQSIFAQHLSYLMSQNDLKPKLSLLSHFISTHVDNFQQMLQLSGRLALVSYNTSGRFKSLNHFLHESDDVDSDLEFDEDTEEESDEDKVKEDEDKVEDEEDDEDEDGDEDDDEDEDGDEDDDDKMDT